MTAIITCGDTRQSLAAVRSLGRAEIPIAVAATRRPALALWSRFANSTFLTRDPIANSKEFAEQIGEELRGRYAISVLASSDDALWALSRFREHLPVNARRLLPPHYSVVRSLDQEALHHFAQSVGVPCAPLIRVPANIDAEQSYNLLENQSFPLLLRPIISWNEREEGARRLTLPLVIYSKAELKEILSERQTKFESGFLASPHQRQRALSYFGVAERGDVLVEGFQERLNELEPYNGVATLAATIEAVPSIRRYAQELLGASQWQGPFKVEFIKDARGNYRLVSLIGRLWGSLQLSISAGLNIPLILYRLSEGTLTRDLLKNARPHVRMRWLMGDAMAKFFGRTQFISNMWQVGKALAHNPLGRNYRKKPKMQNCYDVLEWEDPMPFFFELQQKTWRRAFGSD